MELARWFERRFDFSFPVELYPNTCVRLRGTPARIEELTRDLPRNVLVRRAGEKWSIQENAGHLLDLESLWLARVNDFLAGTVDLSAADLSNRGTFQARYNERPIQEILCRFSFTQARVA